MADKIHMQLAYKSLILFSLFSCNITFADTTDLTNTMNGIGSVTGEITNAVGTTLNQVAGIQQMGNQSNTNLMMQSSLMSLNAVQSNLAGAITQANSCANNAKEDTSKYSNAKISGADQIAGTDVSCGNAKTVIDSSKAILSKIKETTAQLACVINLQNNIGTIAENAKQSFTQLTNAANQYYSNQDQAANQYKDMAAQLDSELTGYNGQVAGLRQAAVGLNNLLNSGSGGKDQSRGLIRQASDLRKQRSAVANQWQSMLIQDTFRCFSSDTTQLCDTDGKPDSPANCLLNSVSGRQSNSMAQESYNNTNRKLLQQVFAKQFGILNRGSVNTKELNAEDQNGFLSYSSDQFSSLNSRMGIILENTRFAGGVDSAVLSNFFQNKMKDCYNNAIKNYNADLNSTQGSGAYGSLLYNLTEGEKNLSLASSNAIAQITDQMSAFNTSFSKSYSSDLSQFKSNCAASNDPAISVDCVSKLQATLQSAIDGTSTSVTLLDGSVFKANAAPIGLNIPNLAFNSSGQPIKTTTPVSCVGFTACLTVLKNSHDSYMQSEGATRAALKNFVATHNQNIDSAMNQITTQFSGVNTLVTKALSNINQQLTGMGITASLQGSQTTGTPLQVDATTGLYKVPTAMKDALASKGAYTEITGVSDLTAALNSTRSQLIPKLAAASVMLEKCTLKKSDYQNVLNYVKCDAKTCSKSLPSTIAKMENLLRKTGTAGGANADSSPTKDLISCLKQKPSLSDLDDTQKNNIHDLEQNLTNLTNDAKATIEEKKKNIKDAQDALKKQNDDYAFQLKKQNFSQSDLNDAQKENIRYLEQNIATATSDAKKTTDELNKNINDAQEALRKQNNQYATDLKDNAKNSCFAQAEEDLSSLNTDARPEFKESNANLIDQFSSYIDGCNSGFSKDDKGGSDTSCKDLKSALGSLIDKAPDSATPEDDAAAKDDNPDGFKGGKDLIKPAAK